MREANGEDRRQSSQHSAHECRAGTEYWREATGLLVIFVGVARSLSSSRSADDTAPATCSIGMRRSGHVGTTTAAAAAAAY